VLVGTLDSRLHAIGFEPELIDTFALITRAGAKLSRPVEDLLSQFTTHLVTLMAKSGADHNSAG
jgi:hypothetical protein